MTEKPNPAAKLPFDIPAPAPARVAATSPERPPGCFLDRAFPTLCPFASAGRAPECSGCGHWDPDWAVFEAALMAGAQKKAGGLIPKKLRGKGKR